MKTCFALLLLAAPCLAGRAAEAADWTQFRGPGGSGVAEDARPPLEFGPEKNVKWKVPAPSGMSSPIIAGDKLVITAFEDGKLLTIAYDRASGKEAWRAVAPAKELEPFNKTMSSPAASTPATDGERIVSYFGSCGLLCYDLNGKELWKYELPPVSIPGGFGSGTSPVIADGVVLLVRDQVKGAEILAIDAASGELKWRQPRTSAGSYATPVVWDTPEGKLVVAAGHARMNAYNLASGEPQWTLEGIPSGCCASPITAEGLLLFAGWSPGGADDPENQMPKFDDFIKDTDKNKDGALGKDEADKDFEAFFDSQDANKDGKVTRDEWDAIIKYMQEGTNRAFALEAGDLETDKEGKLDDSRLLWQQTKGLPYVTTAIAYRGQFLMVRDGGLVTAYDAKTGDEIFQDRAAAAGTYYASPVAANGHVYFTSLDGAITVLKGGSDEAAVVASNPKLDETTAATPAIADDTLYVRTDKHLWAFAEAK